MPETTTERKCHLQHIFLKKIKPAVRVSVHGRPADSNRSGGALNFRATCSQCVASDGTYTAYAKWHLVGTRKHSLVIRAAGEHLHEEVPEGGMLWSAAEYAIISDICNGKAHITTREIRDKFKEAHIKMRCTDSQLHNFIKRYNNSNRLHPARDQLPVCQFQSHIDDWLRKQPTPEARIRSDLIVLRNSRLPVINEKEICVPFACDGMLNRIKEAQGRKLKLVVDAKKNVVNKDWSILSAGWIANRQEASTTRIRGRGCSKKGVQVSLQTSTMELILQAIIHDETDTISIIYAFAIILFH